jgi:hypothetical protein
MLKKKSNHQSAWSACLRQVAEPQLGQLPPDPPQRTGTGS